MSHCPDCYIGGEGAWECGHEEEIAFLQHVLESARAQWMEQIKSLTDERDALRNQLDVMAKAVLKLVRERDVLKERLAQQKVYVPKY